MAVTQIVNDTTRLKVYSTATDYVTIAKASIKLRLDNDVVWLYDNSASAIVNNGGEPQIYPLYYRQINPPVAANANALLIAIDAMLNAGTSGGDANAANQVRLINEFKKLSGESSVVKNANDESVFSNSLGTDDIYKRLAAISANILYSANPWFFNPGNGHNYIADLQSNANELCIHPLNALATSLVLSNATMAGLKSDYDNYLSVSANKYEVSRQLIYDPVGLVFIMFITYSTN